MLSRYGFEFNIKDGDYIASNFSATGFQNFHPPTYINMSALIFVGGVFLDHVDKSWLWSSSAVSGKIAYATVSSTQVINPASQLSKYFGVSLRWMITTVSDYKRGYRDFESKD